VLARPLLKANALANLQTFDAVIAAIDVHKNISAAAVRLDKSEAAIIPVIFTTPVGMFLSDRRIGRAKLRSDVGADLCRPSLRPPVRQTDGI
jgi:hypothetical protein